MFRKFALEGIYSFGGLTVNGEDDSHNFEANNDMRYMPIGKGPQGWRILTIAGRPPSPRYFMSLESFERNNMLLVFGGRTIAKVGETNIGLNDVWLMTLKHPQWYYLDCKGTIPSQRYSHVSGIYENMLIVFGGLSNGSFCQNDLFILQIDPHHAVKSKKIATKRLTEKTIQAFKYSIAFKRNRKERILKLMKKAGDPLINPIRRRFRRIV